MNIENDMGSKTPPTLDLPGDIVEYPWVNDMILDIIVLVTIEGKNKYTYRDVGTSSY